MTVTKRANPLAPWSDQILLAFGRRGQTFVEPLVSGLFDNNFIFNPTISKTQAIGTTCPEPVFFGHLMIFLLNDQKIKSISSYRLFYPITKIPENEKITDVFKLFRRYVRNVSAKKKEFRRDCESDTVERVIMPQQGANQIDWQRQSKKTFQQNLIHCPRYDHELRASNHALVWRTPVCALGRRRRVGHMTSGAQSSAVDIKQKKQGAINQFIQ